MKKQDREQVTNNIKMKKQNKEQATNNKSNKKEQQNTDIIKQNQEGESKFHTYLWYFIIFSLIGLAVEGIAYLILNQTEGARGLLLGSLCFIYGIAAIVLIPVLSKYRSKKVKLFLMSILLVSLVQYVISFMLEGINGAKFWDYTTQMYNLNGRICLMYSIILGIITTIVILLKQYIDKLINKLQGKTRKIVDIIVTILVIIEILFTVWGLVVYSRNAKDALSGKNYISNNNAIEKFENEVFTNELMGKLFPNLRILDDNGILIFATNILED